MTGIKICGLTIVEDAIAAAEAGATHLGIVFYGPSPRFVPPDRAAPLVREVRRRGLPCSWIGVFVDEPVDRVRRIAAALRLDGVQFHGNEPSTVAESLLGDGLFVIKALRIARRSDLEGMAGCPASAILLDTYVAGQPGGTGQSFDWTMARTLRSDRPILLSGGLTPENVASAIRIVRPWGVDVSSGVEDASGKKDAEKMRRFVAAAKESLDRGEERNEQPI